MLQNAALRGMRNERERQTERETERETGRDGERDRQREPMLYHVVLYIGGTLFW